MWVTVDSPWVAGVDRSAFAASLRACAAAGSPLVLSTHLPPARECSTSMLAVLAGPPDLPPFAGPDQAALEALLAGFAPDQRSDEPPMLAAT
jgi:hypothetical protein